ncbi:MAG: DUF6515 family protein [Mixta calida]|uniref:Lipoprotein n=1 Tax=Mixta calida TaxID=665913 RepID=A0ABM6S1C1_9GAMM|nr:MULTISPECIES: DUF6515 family protein [Mixta]AIX73913.1 hypothetical protein PSNIH2_08995 [Pantoea sp. PSNIH2]MBS6057726.1 hypothetical protein [Pantoea sp.]POU48885.1 hypothetical protein C3380_10885 [Pantoea sp. PSNIH5]POU67169.1 hypothetical protein C3374_11220 [Pantoea sp. PSNIH4]POY68556.1 hypothetical protein C3402_06710 [Pantoea sp. PSNIH3]HCW47461.1 hypothetical protein [Erwiniaceae bacterium]
MKKVIASLLALTLTAPAVAVAHPYGPAPGPGWRHGGEWGGHGWGRPAPFRFLPEAATAVLIGGLTYYLLNGNVYQRQGETYVMVQPPTERMTMGDAMRALDYNGRRYYVQDGHYYERNIDGEYLEVPRPPGL